MVPLIRAVWACWAVFIIVWAITSLQAKASVRRPFSSVGWYARIAMLVLVFLLARFRVLGPLSRASFPYPVMVAGLTLTLLGVGFAIWARLALGGNWGMPMTLREKPELVTSGPYALVRHPIYTGMICGMLGTALAVGPSFFVIFVLACAYFVVSVRQEELDMLEHFPDAYPAYRARTKALIPFVY